MPIYTPNKDYTYNNCDLTVLHLHVHVILTFSVDFIVKDTPFNDGGRLSLYREREREREQYKYTNIYIITEPYTSQ